MPTACWALLQYMVHLQPHTTPRKTQFWSPTGGTGTPSMFGIIRSAGHLRVSLLTALVNTFNRCGRCSTDWSALGQYVFGGPNAPPRYTTYFQKVHPGLGLLSKPSF